MERDDIKSKMSVLRTEFGEKTSEDIHGMEQQAAEKTNYLDLKKAAKQIDEEITSLNKQLERELAIAQTAGMTPEQANKIADLAQSISKATAEQKENFLRINEHESQLRIDIKDSVINAGYKVRDAFKDIANGMMDKAVSGVATIGAMVDKIQEGTKNAISVGAATKDTIFTNVEEKINQINRNYMSYNYNKDKSIAETLDKVTDTLEKHFQKSASIKEAFKDLGRAFLGKERQGDKGEYTPAEKAVVETLRGMSDGLKQEMKGLEREFNLSKELSLQNIRSAQEVRKNAGMEKSSSLQERFDDAKERSIDSKRDRAEQMADKAMDKGGKEKEM